MPTHAQKKGPTKAQKKLDQRRQDYSLMVNDPTTRKDYSGYHKPGSMNRRKS